MAKYLPFLPISVVPIFSIAIFLVAVTGVKVVKTDTSFLTFYFSFEDTY